MPTHVWIRKDTWDKPKEEQVVVEVIRKIADHDLPPQTDEYADADKYEWQKSFAGAKTSIVGFGQKGYWMRRDYW